MACLPQALTWPALLPAVVFEMVSHLEELRIPVEAVHSEGGAGQFEIVLQHADALKVWSLCKCFSLQMCVRARVCSHAVQKVPRQGTHVLGTARLYTGCQPSMYAQPCYIPKQSDN